MIVNNTGSACRHRKRVHEGTVSAHPLHPWSSCQTRRRHTHISLVQDRISRIVCLAYLSLYFNEILK
jgi:hypothetical protein